VPFFVAGGHLPAIVSQAGSAGKQVMCPDRATADSFARTSYWWLFRQLMDQVKGEAISARPGYYGARNRLVRARFDQLEQEFAACVPEVVRGYAGSGDGSILAGFSERCVEQVVVVLSDLLNELSEVYP
jgi:hypothetical protein